MLKNFPKGSKNFQSFQKKGGGGKAKNAKQMNDSSDSSDSSDDSSDYEVQTPQPFQKKAANGREQNMKKKNQEPSDSSDDSSSETDSDTAVINTKKNVPKQLNTKLAKPATLPQQKKGKSVPQKQQDSSDDSSEDDEHTSNLLLNKKQAQTPLVLAATSKIKQKQKTPTQVSADSSDDSSEEDSDSSEDSDIADKLANKKIQSNNQTQVTKPADNKISKSKQIQPSKGKIPVEADSSDSSDDDTDSSDDEGSKTQVTKKPEVIRNTGGNKQGVTLAAFETSKAGKKRKLDSVANEPPKKMSTKDSSSPMNDAINEQLARFQNLPKELGEVKIDIRKAMERRLRRQSLNGLFLEGNLGGSNKSDLQKLVSSDIQAVKWKHTIDSAVLTFKTKETAEKASSKLRNKKLNGMRLAVKDESPGEPCEMLCVHSDYGRIRISDIKEVFPTAEEVSQKKGFYVTRLFATYKKKAAAKQALEAAVNTRVRGSLILPKFVPDKGDHIDNSSGDHDPTAAMETDDTESTDDQTQQDKSSEAQDDDDDESDDSEDEDDSDD